MTLEAQDLSIHLASINFMLLNEAREEILIPSLFRFQFKLELNQKSIFNDEILVNNGT